ncbi:uncharacterized protein A1O5_10335 [Cladophialophora psammophila CBS 110553]|uniref:Nephrocystin 3-like N-terminal domain-containing protein n=1 Tax=Cladophialophora psammophila CBS 110553 TaxID=1182543 RepID=W9X891_9EURO|nr:uncharacterized protein A1O5_10335 [Cladophialophora psammophila CBS 110553]EXJ66664.1 hypothetical protein A1O5_10335 [Cladophialophora psammophila CBS 110553]
MKLIAAECLASLYYKEIHSRRDRVVKSSYGTNQWIWGNPDFREWDTARSDILWIEGKPGCGKSTLAKEIQSHLDKKNDRRAKNEAAFNIAGFQSPLVTDHFYSARQHAMGVSHELMLRSLLYQILQADPTLFAEIQGQFRALRAASNGTVQWTWDDLEGSFQRIKRSRGSSRKIFCILDAMDESKSDERNIEQRSRVLKLLRTLCSDEKSQKSSPIAFKFIVLSRPARDIQRGLKGCRKIEMHKENARDIRVLVDRGLKSLRELIRQDDSEEDTGSDDDSVAISWATTLTPSIASHCRSSSEAYLKGKAAADQTEEQQIQEMRKYLIENADGVILWVLLVIQELSVQVAKGFFTFRSLKERLTKLPMDLTEFYEQMVKNLCDNNDADSIKTARKMLIWVSFSQRPLKINELWEAATMPLDTPVTTFDTLVQARAHKRSPTQLWLGMLELCGPFIEVTHEGVAVISRASSKTKKVLGSDTVQLLHQTVKEFLVRPEAGPFRVNPEDPGRVFDACLNYITVALPVPGLPQTADSAMISDADPFFRDLAEGLADRPLLSYCLLLLKKRSSDLSEKASASLLSHDPQIWFLLADWPGILAVWLPKNQIPGADVPSRSSASATSVSYQHGWQRVEQHHLPASTYGFPRQCYSDCAPLDDRERELMQEFRALVYVAACRLGHEGVVDLLLHLPRHAVSDCCQDIMVSALTSAATVQDETQVDLLCRSPLFREVGNYGRLQNAVLAATRNNDLRLVKILLDNWSGRIFSIGYPLHLAAGTGSVELAEYLAWKLVNIDCLDGDGKTALDVANARGWEPMVKMLRSLGAKTSCGLREHTEKAEKMRRLAGELAKPTSMVRYHNGTSSTADAHDYQVQPLSYYSPYPPILDHPHAPEGHAYRL